MQMINAICWLFITARKRSLRRLCFHRCLSVQGGGVCLNACWDTHPPDRYPLGRYTQPGQVHPLAGTPPGAVHAGIQSTRWAVHIPLECILVLIYFKQMSISATKRFIRAISWKARMHSSRMHTARSLTVSRSIQWGGGAAGGELPTPSGCKPPRCRLPLDADPPGSRQTGVKTITLPQTSFAGGKDISKWSLL